VSWISVYKRTVTLCTVGLLGIIAVWVLCLTFRTDPLAKELSSLQAQASSLHSKLAELEGAPSKGNAKEERAQRLRDLSASARGSSANVLAALRAGNRDAAQKSFAEVESASKTAEEIGSHGAEPAAGSATILLQARKLTDDYQTLENSTEGLRDRAATAKKTKISAECDSLIEDLLASHRRAARLAKSPEISADDTTTAELIKAIQNAADSAQPALAAYVGPAHLPFEPKDATLRIVATSDLAEKLVLPLLRAKEKGEAVGPTGGRWYYTAGPQKILVQSANSAFQNLIRGETDLLFTDAPPSADEASAFTRAYPNATLDSRAYADVIGLDAITFSTDPGSPLAIIAPGDLTNGAPHIGGAHGTPERSAAERFRVSVTEETTQRPADAVLGQPGKLAIGVFHNEGANIKAQRLAFQASPQAKALKPSPFTIATEDYKFAFRIYAFNRPKASPGAVDLVRFATSDRGQSVVSDQGFVDLRLHVEAEPV
jgi:hypothetical protein